MKRTKEDIALDAIYEGLLILSTLARETGQPIWATDSVPLGRLDSLARELGYDSAEHVFETVDADRAQRSEQWRGVYDCVTW